MMTETRTITAALGRRCAETLVRAIPEPEFTETWHPHSHGKVIDATALAVESLGIKVKEKNYSLIGGGLKMFGLWQVEEKDGKYNCIGFRNSMDKSMSIGFISILTVIVCTNQITHGNYFQLRRHTSKLDVDQLSLLAANAISKVAADFSVTNAWHEDLKEVELNHERLERLTIQAMRIGVLLPTKFNEFDTLLFGSKDESPSYGQTLYGFHGALTQIIREQSYGKNVWMNQRITTFVNEIRTSH